MGLEGQVILRDQRNKREEGRKSVSKIFITGHAEKRICGQRVGHDWATEVIPLNHIVYKGNFSKKKKNFALNQWDWLATSLPYD